MENRLKERLTGAAILVALIVILVPQMFRGQGGDTTVASNSSSASDGPPVRSYTIDLSNNPKSGGPVQSTGDSAESAPAAPAQSPPISPPPAPAPAAQTAQTPQAPAPVAPTPSPVHIAKATAPPPPTVPAAAAKPQAAGGWSVQLGLFTKRENAERQMSDARARGFAVSISSADPKGMFHVRVAGLADRAAAQAVEQKLKAQGLPAAVVAP
jgi:DedD protein